MSTNITTARIGLAEEIKHCKTAIGHFSARLEKLTRMLSDLDGIDTTTTTTPTTAATKKRGRPPAASVSKASKPKPQATNGAEVATEAPSKPAKQKSKLPSTGSDFMMALLTDTPQSLADLHKAALTAVGKVKADDAQKLKGRLVTFLATAVKAGQVLSAGERRDRRYSHVVQN